MSFHDSVPHLIVDAARIAAPVFKDEGWMYQIDGNHAVVPSETDLAAKLGALMEMEGQSAESGRFRVRRSMVDGDEVVTVYLNLGCHIYPTPPLTEGE